MLLHLILKENLSHKVVFTSNGWLNATKTAENYDRIVYDYLNSEKTKEYIEVLAKHLNCRIEELQITNQSDTSEFEQGTFLHPKLAIDFARWISPSFAIWCDEQIANILNQKVFPQSFPKALRLYADQLEKNQILENRNKKLVEDYTILEDKAFDNWELFRLYLRPTKEDVNRLIKKTRNNHRKNALLLSKKVRHFLFSTMKEKASHFPYKFYLLHFLHNLQTHHFSVSRFYFF